MRSFDRNLNMNYYRNANSQMRSLMENKWRLFETPASQIYSAN